MLLGALVFVGCTSAVDNADPTPSGGVAGPVESVVRVEADFATYPSLDGLTNSSENVFEGMVVSHQVVAGAPLGTDEAGDPITSPPLTEFQVNVTQVFRGSLPAGSSVLVVTLGGELDGTLYRAAEGQLLADGSTHIFFTGPVMEGRVAPLAGGNAMGAKNSEGSYTLPTEVWESGSPLTFTASQLRPIRYVWGGFNPPLGKNSDKIPSFKAGSTVPVKFVLRDTEGNVIQPATAPVWLEPAQGSSLGSPLDAGGTSSPPVASGDEFYWDGEAWHYNWVTLRSQAGSHWRIGTQLEGSEVQYIWVALR